MAGAGIRALINKIWLNPSAVKPFQYRGEFRTPSPGSQKPRDFSLEAADKTETLSSIYYYPRGQKSKPNPTAVLEADPAAQTIVSPKTLARAREQAEKERIRREVVAAAEKAGKKPPAEAPPATNITPIVEFKEFEIDPKSIPDWHADVKRQCPPGKRFWSPQHQPEMEVDVAKYYKDRANTKTV